jgi:hypothetical protein
VPGDEANRAEEAGGAKALVGARAQCPNDVLPSSSFSNIPLRGEAKILEGKCDV